MTENMDVPMRLPNTPAESSPAQDVELTIRQAYQADNDFIFTCPLTWSIKQVKEHVRTCLDSHPAVSSQRLIFSGAPLRDEQILSNILSERSYVTGEGEQVFFHLMITQPFETAPAAELRRRNVLGNNAAAGTQATQPADLHPAYAQNAAAWAQYWEAYNRLSPEAQAEENQRLMTHYYSYASATPMWVQAQPQNPLEGWRARVQGHAQPAAAPAAPAAPAQAGAAANGGRVDFLEVTYRVFKLILLFSAILLYSSFERFALVLCAALFIYFIQLRRNHARNRAQAAAAAPAQPAEQAHVNNNNNGENEGGEANNTNPPVEGETTEETPAPAEPPQSGMQVFLATCYSFVTSFFASLVPDHPMPMDLN